MSLTVTSAIASVRRDSITHRLPYAIVGAGGGIVINAAATEGLKRSVKELRPDRSTDNSFPSRHTSWAFAASTVMSDLLYRHSPWWSVGAQAISSGIGIQRVASRRHWGSDVVAGASIGIVSTELAFILSRKIFGIPSPWSTSHPNIFRPTFALSTEAIYWLNSPYWHELCTGFGTALRFSLPFTKYWGFATSLHAASMPVKIDGIYSSPLSAISATVGLRGHFQLPCERLAFVCNAECGARRWIGHKDLRHADYGFDAEIGAAIEWQLTPKYGFRGNAAYNLTTMHTALHAITLSVSSLVIF